MISMAAPMQLRNRLILRHSVATGTPESVQDDYCLKDLDRSDGRHSSTRHILSPMSTSSVQQSPDYHPATQRFLAGSFIKAGVDWHFCH